MYQYRFFYAFPLLAFSAVQAAEPWSSDWKRSMLSSINTAFSGGPGASALYGLAALVIAVVVLVVLVEIRRSYRKRMVIDGIGRDKFHERAAKLHLDTRDQAFLGELVDLVGAEHADALLSSPTVFENSLESYYSYKGIHRLDDSTLAHVRQVRDHLGYLRLSTEVPYVSSRQFQLHGQAFAQVEGADGYSDEAGNSKWKSSILRVDERSWSISRPDGPIIPRGTVVRLNMTRAGDAEYRIETRVIADEKGELFLEHTRKLSRNQLRNWVRVDVDIPVKALRVLPGDVRDKIEEMMIGKIRDLSGGGLSLTLASKLERGGILDLEFELPGHGMVRDLRVKIVRVQGPLNGDVAKVLHSAAFEGESKAIQEKIIQFVFEKQRKEARLRDVK